MIYEYFCECGHVTEYLTDNYNLEEVRCEKCKLMAKRGLSYCNFKGADHWRIMDSLAGEKYD